jgi:hypothetical protein
LLSRWHAARTGIGSERIIGFEPWARIYLKMRGYSVTAVSRPLNLANSRFLAFTEEGGRVMAHPCNLDTIDGNLRWYLWQPR